eukprot:TRINITY_DN16199_c0_g1_i1.p1 TRINITY_DN16199_c0_g1~~TRINITY_DN16199_c0_g1_i1.p1  ORF type:complete len:1019 (+),score=272.45 TRINITY_DN16199_c0_g1_i1:200-3256(+)
MPLGEILGSEAVGAAGVALFAYNRGNYLFDNSLRFERFNSAREFGIAQTGMYRKDLRKLTELTTKKTTLWCISASLCMALDIALFCAGRLGLHGASPPGWIQGLFLTNNAASFAWMGLTIWLAMHANFRCQAATVHLLTRKVRVPVPTLAQLDKARRLASEFEQQSWSDIFRVPYVMSTGVPSTDNLPGDISPRHAPRRSRGGDATSWVREEWQTDRAGVITGGVTGDVPAVAPRAEEMPAPEHFNLYAAAQKEWWPYDAYSRVCMLYGFIALIHGLGYYGLGHINIEARAFWVAYAVGFILMVLLALLLRFDIIKGQHKQTEYLPNCEFAGPLAMLPAAIAMSLEFRVEYSEAAMITSYVFQILAYLLQIVYQLRLLEVLLPDDWHNAMKVEERVGFEWWPDSWKLPSHFQHVLYLVAPPQKLAKGQNDIVRELKEGSGGFEMVSGKSIMSEEEEKRQARYLEELLEWALSVDIMSRLSEGGQAQVREVSQAFTQAKTHKRKEKGEEQQDLGRTLRQCIQSLDTIMTREGITPQGLGVTDEDGSSPLTPRTMDSDMGSKPTAGASNVCLNMGYCQPWKLVAVVKIAMIVGWVFCLLGTILEMFIGEQGLVTAPHWSRPPMTRASRHPHETGTPFGLQNEAAGSERWLPEQLAWHEEKRGEEVDTIGRGAGYPGQPSTGIRRLSDAGVHDAMQNFFAQLPEQVTNAAGEMMRHTSSEADFRGYSKVLAGASMPRLASAPPAAFDYEPEPVAWPAFFEPKLIACRHQETQRTVAALSSRGVGAMALLGQKADSNAQQFRLTGLSHLPPLVGASWSHASDKEGLMLVSRAGHLVHCAGAGPDAEGRWACAELASTSSPVPAGVRLSAAAAAWLPGMAGVGGQHRLHTALIDERTPELAALYMLEEDGSWLPLGEIAVPRAAAGRASLSFVNEGELLMGLDGGVVLRKRLSDGAVLEAPDAAATGASSGGRAEWKGACGFHATAGGGVAHLVLRQKQAAAWRPEVIAVPNESRQGAAEIVL